MGLVKSAMGIGGLLCLGIGDTIRVTLTADPVEEIVAAKKILKAAGLRQGGREPHRLPHLRPHPHRPDPHGGGGGAAPGMNCTKNITVAVMGCAVNGPGEAAGADIGIAGGNGRGPDFPQRRNPLQSTRRSSWWTS